MARRRLAFRRSCRPNQSRWRFQTRWAQFKLGLSRPISFISLVIFTILLCLIGTPLLARSPTPAAKPPTHLSRLPSPSSLSPSSPSPTFHQLLAQSSPTPAPKDTPPQNNADSEAARWAERGRRAFDQGRFDAAATAFQQAAQAYGQAGAARQQGVMLSNVSLAYQQLGQWDAAAAAIEQAIALLPEPSLPTVTPDQIISWRARAQALDIQASLQFAQGQAQGAAETWAEAAASYKQANSPDQAVQSQLNQAQALQSLGFYQRIIDLLAPIAADLQNQPLLSPEITSPEASSTPDDLGSSEPASSPESIPTDASSPAPTETPSVEMSPTEALSAEATGPDLASPPSLSPSTAAAVLRSLGEAKQSVGDVAEAKADLLESLALADRLDQPGAVAAARLSLGNLAQAQWQQQQILRAAGVLGSRKNPGEEFWQEALTYYRQVAMDARATDALRLQGQLGQLNLWRDRSQQDSAITTEIERWQALGSLRSNIQAQLQSQLQPVDLAFASTQLNFARTLARLRQDSALLLEQLEIGELATRFTPPPTQAEIRTLRSLLTQTEGNLPTVETIARLFLATSQTATQLGDPQLQAYALADLALLYEQTEQYDIAEDLTLRSLGLAQNSRNAADISYRLQGQLCEVRQRQADVSGAIAACTAAVGTAQTLREDLAASSRDIQFSFQKQVEPIYRDLVDLLLQEEDLTPSASDENLKQARTIIESLQLAELDNFFREACLDAEPVEIDQVDTTAAVVYPIILPERLEIILSLPDKSLRRYSTPVAKDEVDEVFDALQKAVLNRNSSLDPTASRSGERGVGVVSAPREVTVIDSNSAGGSRGRSRSGPLLPYAQQAYDWLIRPLDNQLQQSNIKTLVFVLDGALRSVPMSVLHDGDQYLIENYAVALTPGLQLIDPKPLARQKLRAIVAGLTEARDGFPALLAVDEEVAAIEQQVSSKVLFNKTFNTFNLETKIGTLPFPIVHLATHGQFSSNLDETFILTWDNRYTVNQLSGLLQASELSRGDRAIELLVLSACETATGDDRAALGLAGVAMRSGARSTLATLWQVNDASTSQLMQDFYNRLVDRELTKAEMLRQAQLSLLKDSTYNHPYYWSAFVLVGNWL